MVDHNHHHSTRLATTPATIYTSMNMNQVKADIGRQHLMTPEIMRDYLAHGRDQMITILHAKVAQKSYGSEKRFFCPPPSVYVGGDGWQAKKQELVKNGESDDSTRLVMWISIGSSAERDMQPLGLENNFAAAKALFISDSDKRKNFSLRLKMYYANETEIGVFHSKKIKVISKPSKKKQSIKNSDLCIASNTKVALFNRLRSQTVSTRYLFADDNAFYASGTQWGSFNIYLVDENWSPENEAHDDSAMLHENAPVGRDDSYGETSSVTEFKLRDGYIHYGSTIKLVCSKTGMALPDMIIRKVDKNAVMLDADDPVSQLHKCCFMLKHNRKYMCLEQDRIVFTSSNETNQPNQEIVNESSCWTIISTDKAEYCWCEALGPALEPVSPVPIINHIRSNQNYEAPTLDIFGENFTLNLKVWFDDVEANTAYKSETVLSCIVPDVSMFTSRQSDNSSNYYSHSSKYNKQVIQVKITLVRYDGVIYNTGFHFTYTGEPPSLATSAHTIPVQQSINI